jgi:hypothetical protein
MRQFHIRCSVFFSDDNERILLVAAVALFVAARYAPPDIQCQKTAEEQGKEAKRQRNHDFLELCHASCLVHLLCCQLRHQQPRHLHEQQQQQRRRQYLYFSTSKASKLSTRTSNGPPISNRTTQSNPSPTSSCPSASRRRLAPTSPSLDNTSRLDITPTSARVSVV